MFDELVITILETTPDVVYVPITCHYDFEKRRFSKSYMTPDVR